MRGLLPAIFVSGLLNVFFGIGELDNASHTLFPLLLLLVLLLMKFFLPPCHTWEEMQFA